ncbi:peptide-binding protein [Rhodococcus rhodnii]|uniref:Peptide-binding protein n=1 Tax=Rhodococcus rhodnii TaxID=38312 RepID=A0A6P2CK02_9NOCA|nr:peptide-binding protein [Rhodococcus rhodnii]
MTAGLASACTSDEGEQVPTIGYAIAGDVPTYNPATSTGRWSGALAGLSRVLPGFSYTDPSGSVVADTDIGKAAPVPGDALAVTYSFAESAVWSDGVPMTCDDLVLTWIAHSGRAPEFDVASTAGYRDVDRIDCAPGDKTATVIFGQGRSVADWKSLFGAGEVLPAHVAGAAAGVDDTTAALVDGDADATARIADFWNTGWTLTPGEPVDAARFVASGPYRLEAVDESGVLELVPNDAWWGNRPRTERIEVYPRSADVAALTADGDVEIVDAVGTRSGDLPDGFALTDVVSPAVEQLVLGGGLDDPALRRAFASCVPRDALFAEHGSPGTGAPPASGPGSGVADARFTPRNSLVYGQVAGVADGRYRAGDSAAAADALSGAGSDGATVRIGYRAPDDRRAAVVARIAAACAPAGIVVEDASSPDFTPAALADGAVDAVLGAEGGAQGAAGSQPATRRLQALRSGERANIGGFSSVRYDELVDQLATAASSSARLGLATDAERILWDELPTLPLFDQFRTVAIADGTEAATPNPTETGTGWNMDRWVFRR